MKGTGEFWPQVVEKIVCPRNLNSDMLIQNHSFHFLVAIRVTSTPSTVSTVSTSLGFDTHGADGVFGPRSREMITDWQRARNQPATGFLIAAQQQALLSEAAPALAKYDDDQKKAEEARRKEEAAARARAAASPPPATSYPSRTPSGGGGGGLSCQDTSGRRMEFPGATSCPYGLTPAR